MSVLSEIKSRMMPLLGNRLPKESAVLSMVDNLYRVREKTSLDHFHRQWFVNIAMRAGMQYIQVDSTKGEIRLPPEEEDRVRMVVNMMQPLHMTKVGKMAMDSPVWNVAPFTKDEDAKDCAKMDEALLRNLFNNEEMDIEKIHFLGWAIDVGNVFWKIVWDHEAGNDIEDMDGNSVPEGDVRLVIVPPFDLICDPQAKINALRGQWIIHVHEESLSTIITEWPERGRLVKEERDVSQRSYYQRRILSLIGNQSEYFGADSQGKKTAVVKELFKRPNSKNPKGQYAVVANGVWLNPMEDGNVAPLPYKHLYLDCKFHKEPFPFVAMQDLPLSGSPWARGSMQDQIPIQKGYNRVWSQVIENANNFGNIKILAPKNAELSTEAFDDSGNEVIEYEAGMGEPHPLQPAQLPNHVMNQFQLYHNAFMETSGVHEVSRGQTTSGANSGIAIAGLQQQDDVRLQPTMIFFRNALRKAGEHALALYREFMTEDETRMIQVMGKEGYESIQVNREKMVDRYKVHVQLDTEAAWQKEVKRKQIQDAFQQGLFGNQSDPQIRKMVVAALEYGDLQRFFEESELDEKNAKENIERIELGKLDQVGIIPGNQTDSLSGQLIQIPKLGIKANNWEDHQVHIRIYNNFRKSEKWKRWNPRQKEILNDLADEHAKMLIPPPQDPPPPKVALSISAKATPQEVEQAAGLKVFNSPTPPIENSSSQSNGIPSVAPMGVNPSAISASIGEGTSP